MNLNNLKIGDILVTKQRKYKYKVTDIIEKNGEKIVITQGLNGKYNVNGITFYFDEIQKFCNVGK